MSEIRRSEAMPLSMEVRSEVGPSTAAERICPERPPQTSKAFQRTAAKRIWLEKKPSEPPRPLKQRRGSESGRKKPFPLPTPSPKPLKLRQQSEYCLEKTTKPTMLLEQLQQNESGHNKPPNLPSPLNNGNTANLVGTALSILPRPSTQPQQCEYGRR